MIITSEGQRHLGAVVGTTEYKNRFIDSKIKGLVEDVIELAKIAEEEPQLALTEYTRGLCRRWTYIQRTVSGIAENFQPLENAICDFLIPALLGRPASPQDRAIIALPVRFGGLGIQDPTKTADIEFDASVRVTKPLTNIIYEQQMTLSGLDYHQVNLTKAEIQLEKTARFSQNLKDILDEADPLTQRSLEAAKNRELTHGLHVYQ